MGRTPLLTAALLLLGGVAQAQTFVSSERAGVWEPIATIPGIGALTDHTFSSDDEGNFTVNLPFTFRFLGIDRTDFRVTVNGVAAFGASTPGFGNQDMGNGGSPDEFIAFWWDDLVINGVAGHCQSGVYGVAPNRVFVLEVRDLEHYDNDNRAEVSYQLRLFEGPLGAFEVSYDGLATAVENYTATAGWEGVAGQPFGGFGGCEVRGCDETDFNALIGRVFRVEQVQGPELTGSIGVFGRGAAPLGTANVPVTIDNLGTEAVTNVQSRLLLSADAVVDAADVVVANFTSASIAINGSDAQTITVTVPAGTPPGDYQLLLDVDAPNAITEAVEDNNVVAAADTFATAPDLTPSDVVAPTSVAVGGTVDLTVTVDSLGLDYAGGLEIEVIASRDATLDAADVSVGQALVTLAGLPSEAVNVQVTLPPGLRAGAYYMLARVDPAGLVGQYDLVNDVGAPNAATAVGSDLTALSVTVPPGVTPGQSASFTVRVGNVAEPFIGTVGLTLLASPDPIYDLNDPVLVTQTISLTGVAAEDVVLNFTVPSLPPNIYFPIARLDPAGQVAEVDERNNNLVADQSFAVGPDLSIDLVTLGPISSGSMATMDTRILSTGAPLNGSVEYEVWASADAVLDASDVSLARTTVTFAGETEIVDTRNFTFPSLPPADYTLFARVDGPNAVVEANEGDNLYMNEDGLEVGPDFRPFVDDFMPNPALPTDILNVTGRIFNEEAPYDGLIGVWIALSRDGVYDPTDLLIFQGTLPVVGTTATDVDVSVNLTPFNVRPGTYTVFIIADPQNLIEERREDNNDDDDFSDLTIEGTDVAAIRIDAPTVVYHGEPFDLLSSINNPSAITAATIDVSLVFAADGIFSRGDEVANFSIAQLAPGATDNTSSTVTLPSTFPLGLYSLGLVVDPNDTIFESEEGNNLAVAADRVLVRAPVANVIGSVVETSSRAASGDTLSVTRALQNNGVADAIDVEIAYVLSRDQDLDAGDTIFGRRNVTVPRNDAVRAIDNVVIPTTVMPGSYNLGLVIDPDGLQDEVSEDDNLSFTAVVEVLPADLQVLLTELPRAFVQIPYLAQLNAIGGGLGDPTWRLAGGALPAGLMLGTDGQITGTANEEGAFVFVAEVRRGMRVAEASLTLSVLAEDGPLFVPSYTLAPARIDTQYNAQLIAQGGVPPYSFVVSAGLPPGLTVNSAGQISGAAARVGTYDLLVDVTDQEASTVRGNIALTVFDPRDAVRIDPVLLPSATRGRDYCDARSVELRVAGGEPPYVWTVTSSIVPGLNLSAAGELCGIPEELGTFDFVVRVDDATGGFDTAGFQVNVFSDGGLAILTTTLPQATISVAYATELLGTRGTAPYSWRLAQGSLPEGLSLFSSGTITGTTADVGTSAFTVELTDAVGDRRLEALSIDVVDPSQVVMPTMPEDSGCGCTASDTSSSTGTPLFGLLFGLVLGLRRRRT